MDSSFLIIKELMNYKHLFLLGLIIFLIGQFILVPGNEFVYSLRPIDFAHWSLFVGTLCLIPQIVSFPKSIFSYTGTPLALIGAVCIFGMCVIDFIWWSFPNDEMRMEFTNHISNVPSIWKPFMTIGPSSKIFNLGLLFLSLNYFKKARVGVILILIADLILWHIIPVPYRLVFGYSLTLIGFSIIFLKKEHEYQT